MDPDSPERLRYFQASIETETGLESAIRLLHARQVLTGDPDETRAISIALLDLAADLARLRADRLAFQSEQREIVPPSAVQDRRIKDMVRQLEGMTASAVEATDVIRAATAIVNAFQS